MSLTQVFPLETAETSRKQSNNHIVSCFCLLGAKQQETPIFQIC